MKKCKFKHAFIFCIFAMILSIAFGSLSYTQTASAAKSKTKKAVKTASKATSLSEKKATIYINGKYKIKLKNKKKKATYFYTSNNTKVAKVNASGTITGRNKGSATIKVRYKYDGDFHTVGKFKITIVKSTMNDDCKIVTLHTGESISTNKYLNNANPDATYFIVCYPKGIVSADKNGTITAARQGSAAVSVHEVFNQKTRKVASIAMTVTGASPRYSELKVAYGQKLSLDELIIDKNTSAAYAFSTDKPSLISASSTGITIRSGSSSEQTCILGITETINKKTYNIGTTKLIITNEPFIFTTNQNIETGLGETLKIDSSCVVLSNKRSNATYKLVPKDTSIVSEKLVTIAYGSTTLEIQQKINGQENFTTLPDTVTVMVNAAYIPDDIKIKGITTTVDGDKYKKYPIACRNLNATYYYESEDPSICTVNVGGLNKGEDYLVLTGVKPGKTTVTVYETETKVSTTPSASASPAPSSSPSASPSPSTTSTRRKVGTFTVYVNEKNTATPGPTNAPNGVPENPVASDIISSITMTHRNKTYKGYVSTTSPECIFGDESSDFIDFGTDFGKLTSSSFDVKTTNTKYSVKSMISDDGGYEWIMNVDLGDDDHTMVEIPVTLFEGELDIASVIKSISFKLDTTGSQIEGVEPLKMTEKSITKTSVFPDYTDIKQFEDGNTSFVITFTKNQMIAAGATIYDPTATNPVSLADINDKNLNKTKPSGDVLLKDIQINDYSDTNKTANPALNSKPEIQTEDNEVFTFSLGFENGTVIDCDILLIVTD